MRRDPTLMTFLAALAACSIAGRASAQIDGGVMDAGASDATHDPTVAAQEPDASVADGGLADAAVPEETAPTAAGPEPIDDASAAGGGEASAPEAVADGEPADPQLAGYAGVEEGDIFVGMNGEYRVRLVLMSDIPLRALPRLDPVESANLGQNVWAERWLRLRGLVRLTPGLYLRGQFDVLRGVAAGDLAQGVEPGAEWRDEYGYPGVRLRMLYLEWLFSFGLVRFGQMGFSWGLGMVSNDGDTPPVFGDYRYGDLVRRLLFATRPFEGTPFTLAVAGDWVAWDLLADFEGRGDLAFQGVLSAFWGDEQDRVGAYGVYRWQENELDDTLSGAFFDVFARWGFEDADGARWYAAVEGAYARGKTTYARTVENPEHDLEQLLGVLQLGRTSDRLDVVLETGYASGDSNGEDAMQLRATIDPDHRVGLILFPEVIAAQTARAAHLFSDPALVARPGRGVELLPTNGGVAGAVYLFPYAIYRPLEWFEGRLGAVLGYATADVVDPFAQRAESRTVNYRGGDASARDLGLEIDVAILLKHRIFPHYVLSGGFEGGVLIPGRAFADPAGNVMDPVWLGRLRLGLAMD